MLRLTSVAIAILLLAYTALGTVTAHHDDNDGNTGHQLTFFASMEMNSKTATGNSIAVYPGYLQVLFQAPLANALTAWNNALYSTTGFNVFLTQTGAVTVSSGTDTNFCGYLDDGVTPAHGCPVSGFDYLLPAGGIYMYAPAFANNTHRQSDIMHELGHVLYNAAEHYKGANIAWNCTSIMGHCLQTQVFSHDVDDFKNGYRMQEAPDAAYAQQVTTTKIRHFFEGGCFAGNGITLHAEKRYVFDRSTSGITGSYSYYAETPRIVNNNDDTTPSSIDVQEVPSAGSEWCFKTRGETGAIADASQGYRWSPRSRAYCVRRVGTTDVRVFSNRNDYVTFQIWNNSGAEINSVALLFDGMGAHVCDFDRIASGGYVYCFATGLGSSAGFLDLWFNWVEQGSIGYDAR